MPKIPEFTPKFIEGRGWVVNVPKDFADSGKRERPSFELEKHAEAFAKKKRGQFARGEKGINLDTDSLVDASAALKLLKGTGISLTEAARVALSAHKANGSTETFRERYTRAVADGKARWRKKYKVDMDCLPRWVGEAFMKTRCSLITQESTVQALRENGSKAQSTIDSRMRYVSSILNFKTKHRKSSTIPLLTLKQCRQMLRATVMDAERRAVALMLFAGIRPDAEDGEITRLDWKSVGEKEIYIPIEVSKTKTDRHILITPRLARMLRDHPEAGSVIPKNWRRVSRRIRKAAGLTMEQDITRHTFASHYLAAFGEDKTKAAMGHTANSRTLFQHYRRSVTEEAGKKFFR